VIKQFRLRTAFAESLVRVSVVCVVAGLVPSLAYAEGPTGDPPVLAYEIPKVLQVSDGHVLLFHAFAAGIQNYECRSDATGTTGWVFRQPRAMLLGDDGEPIGIHGRGPFWTAYDGSQVIGASPISAPGRDSASDVPWLLLRGTPDGGAENELVDHPSHFAGACADNARERRAIGGGETDGRFAHVSLVNVGQCGPR